MKGELSVGPATETTVAANWTFSSNIEKLQASLIQEKPKRFLKDESLPLSQTEIVYDGLTPLTEYSVSVEGSVGKDFATLKKKIYTKGKYLTQLVEKGIYEKNRRVTIQYEEYENFFKVCRKKC